MQSTPFKNIALTGIILIALFLIAGVWLTVAGYTDVGGPLIGTAQPASRWDGRDDDRRAEIQQLHVVAARHPETLTVAGERDLDGTADPGGPGHVRGRHRRPAAAVRVDATGPHELRTDRRDDQRRDRWVLRARPSPVR